MKPSAEATTWRKVQKDCPLCKSKVEGMIPGSTFIPSTSPDFRPEGVGVEMTSASILMCNKCGFATVSTQFDDTQGLNTNRVSLVLATLKTPRLFRELDHAAAVERNWKNNLLLLARFSLAAKWLADDTGEKELIHQRTAAAIEAHNNALNHPGLSKEDKAMVTYLIGELNRQAGNQSLALQWLMKAEKLVTQEQLDLVRQQMALLGNENKPTSLPELRKASDANKLSAIARLREINDLQTIGFLKDFCLNCPDRLREDAIKALATDDPKPYHTPIFLAGLRNANFRTVQYSAMAVEKMQVPEAAAIIVDVLKKPQALTEFRLMAALGATATSNEVDYLIGQLKTEQRPHLLFNALVQTRSPKAIPHIVSLLGREPMLSNLYEEEDFRRAGRFVELIKALPDLSRANPEDPLAIFKAHALRLSLIPDADKQLLAALGREGELSQVAALTLAFRGNRAGKNILIENIKYLMGLDDHSITNLYRFLEPSDFKLLSAKMVESKKEELDRFESRRRFLKEQSNSSDETAAEKQRLKRELEAMIWDENWFIYRWIELLAATKNPEAKPLCFTLLESSKPQLRAKAVTSLGWNYDDKIGENIAARLADESDQVKQAIFLAFAKSGDRKFVDLIISAIKEPCLVSTKLAWIQATSRVAPEKAAPIIKLWAESTNTELAENSRKVLLAWNNSNKH